MMVSIHRGFVWWGQELVAVVLSWLRGEGDGLGLLVAWWEVVTGKVAD